MYDYDGDEKWCSVILSSYFSSDGGMFQLLVLYSRSLEGRYLV